jgi:hypothetical protein
MLKDEVRKCSCLFRHLYKSDLGHGQVVSKRKPSCMSLSCYGTYCQLFRKCLKVPLYVRNFLLKSNQSGDASAIDTNFVACCCHSPTTAFLYTWELSQPFGCRMTPE